MMLLLASFMSASLLPASVKAHGAFFSPITRNMQAYYSPPPGIPIEYQANWIAGGGVATTSSTGQVWPFGPHGVCGDPYNTAQKYATYDGWPVTTYQAGDVISLSLFFTADHGGRHEFSICPSANSTEGCFTANPLLRADDVLPGNKYWWSPGPQNYPATGATVGSYQRADGFQGKTTYTLKYKLPPNLTCDSCVLRWYWVTSNSCMPPCDPASPTYDKNTGKCGNPANLVMCGQPGPYPEEYWNCANIKIVSSTSLPSSPSPPSPPPLSSPPPPSSTLPPPSPPPPSSTLPPSPRSSPSPPSPRLSSPPPTAVRSPSPSPPPPPPPPPPAARTPPPSPSPSSCTVNLSTFCNQPGSNTNYYADPCGSATFIQCSGNTAGSVGYRMTCPVGLVWKDAVKACGYP